jgi:hypothetical protein
MSAECKQIAANNKSINFIFVKIDSKELNKSVLNISLRNLLRRVSAKDSAEKYSGLDLSKSESRDLTPFIDPIPIAKTNQDAGTMSNLLPALGKEKDQ